MYNPMYYFSSYYDGYKTSSVAPHWRIRTGIMQGDTANTVEINLALALQNYGISNVDFAIVWGLDHHGRAYRGRHNEFRLLGEAERRDVTNRVRAQCRGVPPFCAAP
jgi:hypothetical protein